MSLKVCFSLQVLFKPLRVLVHPWQFSRKNLQISDFSLYKVILIKSGKLLALVPGGTVAVRTCQLPWGHEGGIILFHCNLVKVDLILQAFNKIILRLRITFGAKTQLGGGIWTLPRLLNQLKKKKHGAERYLRSISQKFNSGSSYVRPPSQVKWRRLQNASKWQQQKYMFHVFMWNSHHTISTSSIKVVVIRVYIDNLGAGTGPLSIEKNMGKIFAWSYI